jgi:hypothetical protein
MSDQEREKVLDLLYDKFVYGLSEEEATELERLGYDPTEAESIEKTVAALGLVDLDEAEMPASLQANLMRDADDYFGTVAADETVPARQIVLDGGSGRSWFGWLGWAVAAAACIALAVTIFTPGRGDVAGILPTPTPTPAEKLTPAQERQRLIESSPQLVRAEWSKGKMDNVNISGDVVWSDEKQIGYLRLKGLPKNDPGRETYQLWIVDESQDPKTPIDGGTFDINSDGEVVIPIDAKLKARNPKAFAITVEKPGGVVVSKQEKLAALAPVKPDQV